VANQLSRLDEAVRVDDLGGEDGGGDRADAGDGVEMVGRQLAIGANQQFFQEFLANVGLLDLSGQVADHGFGSGVGKGGHRGPGLLQERGNPLLG
jgi:hypothetical protein